MIVALLTEKGLLTMSKEELKQEYEYWLKVKDAFEKNKSVKPMSSEETANYNFAVGFVSAINKSAIFRV